jgi:transcriptional regulator with PAS, ATPase and Fis domain
MTIREAAPDAVISRESFMTIPGDGEPGPAAGSRWPSGSREEEIARRLALTPSLHPWVERLALAAGHDLTVLLIGETGSGKTALARLIHDCSPRRAERFLAVSCGALPPELVESELFGHVRGAFTRVGRFAAAGRGTLLLDEIDALSLEHQASLLRVLETGEYEPVGSNQTQRTACRVVAASNSDLEGLVEQGRFRRDLYYRLNVMSFHLPPLRERLQDIAPLVLALARRLGERFGKGALDVGPEGLAALESYSWPGNLRELENVMQQAVLVCDGPVLLLRHLPEAITRRAATTRFSADAPLDTLRRNCEVIEQSLIRRVLADHDYNRTRAAQELGISRITLYKKMLKYGLLKGPASRPGRGMTAPP